MKTEICPWRRVTVFLYVSSSIIHNSFLRVSWKLRSTAYYVYRKKLFEILSFIAYFKPNKIHGRCIFSSSSPILVANMYFLIPIKMSSEISWSLNLLGTIAIRVYSRVRHQKASNGTAARRLSPRWRFKVFGPFYSTSLDLATCASLFVSRSAMCITVPASNENICTRRSPFLASINWVCFQPGHLV